MATSTYTSTPQPTSPPSSSSTALQTHIQEHLTFLLHSSPLYTHLFSNCTLTTASPGIVTILLPLEPKHLNSKHSLHGSVSATLVDFMGGVAIASHDARSNTGVSVDMHVEFVGGAKQGDTLEIKGCADRVGGTLAFTTVTIRKYGVEGPAGLVAMGRHTKFVKVRT